MTARPAPVRRRWSWLVWAVLVGGLAAVWAWQTRRGSDRPPAVDYSVAYGWIEQGKVSSVVLSRSAVEGLLVAPEWVDERPIASFRSARPDDDPELLPLLRRRAVRFRAASDDPPALLQLALALLPWALLIAVVVWMSSRAQRINLAGRPGGGFLDRGRRYERARATETTFADVAGATAAKRDLQEIVQFLTDPARFRRLGTRVPRGALLVGPPGTGKTLLARAVAGEAGVPFYSITGSEFIELFVGVGAARVRELFAQAKEHAPAIVFIDEIDAVGRARGTGLGGGHDEREQTLNQLLAEMDGFERNEQVVVLAATNRPDVLDPALLRPGRFDRRIVIDLPELAARRAILAVHVAGKPLAPEVDLDEWARNTPGFSGADLANLVNEAALQATRRQGDVLEPRDFAAAHDKILLGDPRETRLTPAEKDRVAVHEAGHAVVAWATAGAEPVRRVSILPRGMSLGVTLASPTGDRHVLTRGELLARIVVLLGGHAAELAVLGEPSSGAEHDLRQATELASRMVAHYGMSDELGPAYHEHQEEHAFLGHRIGTAGGTSDATVHAIEVEARAVLRLALATATRTLESHRLDLERLRAALLETETLERDQLEGLLGQPAALAA